MLVLSVLSNLPKGQAELKVGQGKQKTNFPTGQVDLNLFFLPWTQTKMMLHLFGICLAYFVCLPMQFLVTFLFNPFIPRSDHP